MGLRGLPHYIGQACHGIFKTNVKLQNTRVIIDGNNFWRTFILSQRYENDCMLGYGCNYDIYYSSLVTFFNKLEVCGIEAVVLFVGTTGCQESIFERVKERNQEKIDRLASFIENDYKSVNIRESPHALLAKTTLVRCLNNLQIHHLTMDFEEDDQIVALANRWRCPIITSDSDFYLLQYGPGTYAISMNRFDVQVHGPPNDRYIETSSYRSADFATYHDIGIEFLSLFGAVQLEKDESENFMSVVPLQLGERDDDITSLLNKIRDLSEENTFEELLENADQYFFDEEDEERLERIKNHVKNFTSKEAKIEYYSFLEEGETVVRSEIMTRNGACLPEWFIRGLRMSLVSRYLAGVLAVRATSLYTQLEDLDGPSPNVQTARLRAIIWAILLKYDSDETGRVNEFYRETRSIIEVSVEPVLTLNGTPVPSLADIPQMSGTDRLRFVFLAMGIDPSILKPIPEYAWFVVLVTRYWIERCHPTEWFITAIILCYIRLGLPYIPDFSTLSLYCAQWKPHSRDVEVAKRNLWPLIGFKIPPIRNSPERIRIHHKFSEWKAIYSEVYRLNEIMLKPVVEVGPEQCFNGTFVFGVQRFLSEHSDPEREIKRVIGPLYTSVYKPLMEAVM